MGPRFRDRAEAGRRLAERLAHHVGDPDVLVLGLPRGGVPVAAVVAEQLGAPLDVYVVRKLGVPGHRELAMGAIASGGVRVMNEPVVRAAGIPDEVIDHVVAEERDELERRERELRGGRSAPEIEGRTVILVDDGVATGSTIRAAIAALRSLRAGRVVVAVPLASPDVCRELAREAEEVVCVETPEPFHAISLWYDDFTQTSDEEVREALERVAGGGAGAGSGPGPS